MHALTVHLQLYFVCCMREPAGLPAHAQLMASDRKLSQYKIGRGDTSMRARLSMKKRTLSAPPGGLPTVSERSATTPLPMRLNDKRQKFVQVWQQGLLCHLLILLHYALILRSLPSLACRTVACSRLNCSLLLRLPGADEHGDPSSAAACSMHRGPMTLPTDMHACPHAEPAHTEHNSTTCRRHACMRARRVRTCRKSANMHACDLRRAGTRRTSSVCWLCWAWA